MGRIRKEEAGAGGGAGGGTVRRGGARDQLAELYLPQVEQFGITLKPYGVALAGGASTDLADARVLVYRIDTVGVVTSHRIHVKRDMPFEEHAVPSLCVSTLSADSLALCPVVQPGRPHAQGNVAVFGQGYYERRCPLVAGSVQDSVSITLLPDWFKRREGSPGLRAHDARTLFENVAETCADDPARSVDALLRSVTPLFGGSLMSERSLRRRAEAATDLVMAWYGERERAEAAEGTLAQARLVRAARRLVMQHLDEDLSLERIARDLLVSRSRLCAAFKRGTGESLGAFVRRMRMERAALLLDARTMSVAEVARAVGYTRLPSFTVAFERVHGCAPSAWGARG